MRRWFLSYHSPDQPLAENLKLAIERKDSDWRVFFAATHMQLGGSWSAQLAKEIADANAFVLLVGQHGVGNWQVLNMTRRLRDGPRRRPIFLSLSSCWEGQTAPGLPFFCGGFTGSSPRTPLPTRKSADCLRRPRAAVAMPASCGGTPLRTPTS